MLLNLRRLLTVLRLASLAGIARPAPTRTPPPLAQFRVVEELLKEWHAGTSEADITPKGRLAAIFLDSGWSYRVDTGKTGRARDWCGLTISATAWRAGMHRDHRKSFWHTDNVRSFFSYGRRGTHGRTMFSVQLGPDAPVVPIREWHETHGALRKWTETHDLRAIPLELLDIEPGDVALISHSGRTAEADHIVAVYEWDGRYLVTLEGNAKGEGPDGELRRDAVVKVTRDLADARVRNTLFGLGRFSTLDFADGDIEVPAPSFVGRD